MGAPQRPCRAHFERSFGPLRGAHSKPFLVLFCVGFELLRGSTQAFPPHFLELFFGAWGGAPSRPCRAHFLQVRCCAGVALGGGVSAGKVLCRGCLGRRCFCRKGAVQAGPWEVRPCRPSTLKAFNPESGLFPHHSSDAHIVTLSGNYLQK